MQTPITLLQEYGNEMLNRNVERESPEMWVYRFWFYQLICPTQQKQKQRKLICPTEQKAENAVYSRFHQLMYLSRTSTTTVVSYV